MKLKLISLGVIALLVSPISGLAQNNVFPTAGFCGIGTTNPMFPLDVYGNVQISGSLNQQGAIYMYGSNHFSFAHQNGEGVINFGNQGIGGLHFRSVPVAGSMSNYNEVMTIKNNGEIGIGTQTTNGYKLAVNGSIRANAVRVESGWADYVFNENYPLLSMLDLRAYIKENGHLPNVPTADEVEENGVDVSESIEMLLVKVEELTLYVLELEEKVRKLEESRDDEE